MLDSSPKAKKPRDPLRLAMRIGIVALTACIFIVSFLLLVVGVTSVDKCGTVTPADPAFTYDVHDSPEYNSCHSTARILVDIGMAMLVIGFVLIFVSACAIDDDFSCTSNGSYTRDMYGNVVYVCGYGGGMRGGVIMPPSGVPPMHLHAGHH